MAYKITTIPLFKSELTGTKGTGGTSISDKVDLRDLAAVGDCTMRYGIAGTNSGSAGSTVFEYLSSSIEDGTYIASGTFGTVAGAGTGLISFTMPAVPFTKIKAVSGTSNPAVITAELNVR